MQEKTIHIKFVNACLRYLYKKQDIRNLNLQQKKHILNTAQEKSFYQIRDALGSM